MRSDCRSIHAVNAVKFGGARYAAGAGFDYEMAYYTEEKRMQFMRKSIEWHTKAANMNYCNSQSKIAESYIRGDGVPKDYVLAYMWLNICAANGLTEVFSDDIRQRSAEKRDSLALEMTKEQIAEAQKLSRKKIAANDAFIESVESSGAEAVIPPRKGRKVQRSYDKHLYRGRHLVENAIQQLKE